MPLIDLSDEDSALLDAVKKAGGARALDLGMRAYALHQKLYTHKDTAVDYQKAIKTVVPEAQVASDVAAPYVARIDDVDARLNKMIEERDAEKKAAADAAAQGDFDKSWNDTVSAYSLTEEGQEKLINFMKNRKLADPEAAAALYYKQNPEPPAPVTPSSIAPAGWVKGGDFGMPGEDESSSKLLISNPEAWADQEAAGVLTEIRRSAA